MKFIENHEIRAIFDEIEEIQFHYDKSNIKVERKKIHKM